jgi:hypothetical protein
MPRNHASSDLCIESGYEVRRVLKILVKTLRRQVLVAGFAGFAPYIVTNKGGRRRSLGLFLPARRFGGVLGWRSCTQASRQAKPERNEQNGEE